ncbi:DEAD/DEAH box helicase, partial [Aerococcus sp. L_4]
VLTFVNDRSLRDLKKQVGDDIQLTAFYTYGGQLTDQVPSASQNDEDQPLLQEEKEGPAVKAKVRVKKPKQANKAAAPAKARKKNRKRDNKNKGARRHKD